MAASVASAAPVGHVTTVVEVPTPANLNNSAAIERFLLAVEKVQHSTSPAFLADAPSALRDAVTATETRSGGITEHTSFGLATTATQRSKELAQVGITEAPASVVCGWGYKKVSYQPGIITYYTLWLQTDFCWNGTAIIGTPYQTHGGSANWGWSYTTENTTQTWFPAPTRYWSGVEANMRLGLYHNYPYIETYLYGAGTVYTWWNSKN